MNSVFPSFNYSLWFHEFLFLYHTLFIDFPTEDFENQVKEEWRKDIAGMNECFQNQDYHTKTYDEFHEDWFCNAEMFLKYTETFCAFMKYISLGEKNSLEDVVYIFLFLMFPSHKSPRQIAKALLKGKHYSLIDSELLGENKRIYLKSELVSRFKKFVKTINLPVTDVI